VFLGHAGWGFLLFPVVSGALILVSIGWLYNNAVRKTPYPTTGSVPVEGGTTGMEAVLVLQPIQG